MSTNTGLTGTMARVPVRTRRQALGTRTRIAILMVPPTLVLLIFFVLPMFVMASYTFRAGSFGPERNVFTWENYREFFTSDVYLSLLGRSLLMALATSVLCVLMAYPVAYFISFHGGERRSTLLTLILIPAWTSFLLRILAWKLVLSSDGLLSTLLTSVGLMAEPRPILLYTPTAVLVALVYSWIPFVAVPIFSAIERIDRRLLEAAADLGCTEWQAFLRVTLPLSIPGVVSGFLFVFIPTLGEWVTPALVGGARGTMYGNIIQDMFRTALNWPLGSVMSLVMLVMMVILILVFNRFVRWLPVGDS